MARIARSRVLDAVILKHPIRRPIAAGLAMFYIYIIQFINIDLILFYLSLYNREPLIMIVFSRIAPARIINVILIE